MTEELPPGPSRAFGGIAAAVLGALAAQPRIWHDVAPHAPPLLTAASTLPGLVAGWSARWAELMRASAAALHGAAPSPASTAPLGVLAATEALALAVRDAGTIVAALGAQALAEAARADAAAPIAGDRMRALGAVAEAVGGLTLTEAFSRAAADAGVPGARLLAARESFAAALVAHGHLAAATAQRLRASRRQRRQLRAAAPLHAEVITAELIAALQRLGAIVSKLLAGASAEAVDAERLWFGLHAPQPGEKERADG